MKIFIACSKYFYDGIHSIRDELESRGHVVSMPNSYESPMMEEEMKIKGIEEHIKWKSEMLKKDKENILPQDAVLVLNFDKNGMRDYIGGATFMEIVKSWELGKKIYLFNPIPDNIFKDELIGMDPVVINGDLSRIKDENLEVEIRSFISKEKYEELLEFFRENGEFIGEDYQETYYYDCSEDLRVQKNGSGGKIWLKKGRIHDDAREEIELNFDEGGFDKANKIFEGLNYGVEIKWFRKRKEFNWKDIRVCLDYTKGYGYILELERMSDEGGREGVLRFLKDKLSELGVSETSKEEFNKKFNHYKENWRELVNDTFNRKI